MSSILFILLQEETPPVVFETTYIFFAIIVVLLIVFVITRGVFNFLEMMRIEYFKKKQFFNHFYVKRNNLSEDYKSLLRNDFTFYKRLSNLDKRNFEHRIHYYLKNWEFIGNELKVTNTMKVLITATAAKLTFGLRHYKLDSIDKVIIYPEEYYSTINKTMHKGEFNMAYNALIFSWKDLKIGYEIDNDNLNLAVHECIHAMHFSFLKSRAYSTSSAIFIDSFLELRTTLAGDSALKERLIESKYLRDYAFENQFEFISVVVENFIETPLEFRSKFPKIYNKVKEMLNFNFAGY